MNVKDRLEQLMEQQGLSVYRLAQKSYLSWNTVDNILKRDINPTIHTLDMLCNGLGISLVQFFDDTGTTSQISAEQQKYLNKREALDERDRYIIDSMIELMLKDK